VFRARRKPSDFRAEIEAHLHLEAERLREEGLREEDARAAARRAFGNVTQAEERFYEARRWLFWITFGMTCVSLSACCAGLPVLPRWPL
jgi:hypothetical protein